MLNVVVWLDTNNVVRLTDGANIQDISIPIRPDIQSINHASAMISVFDNGKHHWVVLMDGGASKIRVFDLDTQQWMPPWDMGALHAVWYGEISAGVNRLFIANNNDGTGVRVFYLDTTVFTDGGVAYSANIKTNLYDIIQKENPAQLGDMEYVSLETGALTLTDVRYMVDDDPFQASYTSIVANISNPALRTQGTYLLEKWYYLRQPASRRISLLFSWTIPGTSVKLYSMDIAYFIIT